MGSAPGESPPPRTPSALSATSLSAGSLSALLAAVRPFQPEPVYKLSAGAIGQFDDHDFGINIYILPNLS